VSERRAILFRWAGAVVVAAVVVALGTWLTPSTALARTRRAPRKHTAPAVPAESAAPDDTTWGTTGSSVDVVRDPKANQDRLDAQNPFDAVRWLNGCWALEDGKRRVEEQWTASGGVLMVGSGHEYAKPKGNLVESELTRIEFLGGRLVYIAAPSSQPADSFAAIEASGSRVVFENAKHDFPQRIGYERVAPDSVLAWVEGTEGGNPRRVEYPYHRARCGQ
jgi:hypothetical protein